MREDVFKIVKSRMNDMFSDDKTKKIDVPDDFMFRCPRCKATTVMDDFIGNNKVCSSCNYHSRLSAKERLEITVDKGSLVPFCNDMKSKNPIDFLGYEEKITEQQTKTGLSDAVITGVCTIRKNKCVIVAMDSRFMMASMGSVVGEKITRAFELATEKKLPIVIFAASGGARMQEGIVSLMQMAKTSAAAKKHNDSGLLYISVLTDPTTGGVTASFASLGDVIIAEPKVLIGFAGRRVIEDTIRQRLPDDFQSAEFLLEHGFVDIIVERTRMRSKLSRLINLHQG